MPVYKYIFLVLITGCFIQDAYSRANTSYVQRGKKRLQHIPGIETSVQRNRNTIHTSDTMKEHVINKEASVYNQNEQVGHTTLSKSIQMQAASNLVSKSSGHSGFPSGLTDGPVTGTTTNAPNVNCILKPVKSSISMFRHNVYYHNLNFVYIHIVTGGNVTIGKMKGVVGETIWVWTFYGKQGGLEFLDWPIEFEIWSMGLLSPFLRGPFDVTLLPENEHCGDMRVGEKASDEAISTALVNLPIALMNISTDLLEKYGPSFFCYKQRIFLNPKFVYILCKHIVCPVESLKYQCCSYFFNVTALKREIKCPNKPHIYDNLWWVWPIVIAVLLFAFVPLMLMNCAWKLSAVYHKRNRTLSLKNVASNVDQEKETVYLDDKFPVTLSNTLWVPISNICFKKSSVSSRLIRFVLPFLSLGFILLQIFLDSKYLHGFVLTSIQAGVPLGFRSIAAGYEESRRNFMPLFGGPYVTLSIYLFITCVAITVPPSLSEFMARGLQQRFFPSELKLALMFDLRRIERLGSVPILRLRGFQRIYNTYLGQFYMLLNIKFWGEVWDILVNRWMNFAQSRFYYIFLPFYVFMCTIELVLCIAINGFPIVSFAITITRAYSFFNVFGVRSGGMRLVHKLLAGLASMVLVVVVLFFLYMFCTIFVDATLFITRLFIFTYTGIVIYPKLSYGYFIFAFTVVYYIWDCVRNYSKFYWRVLKITISACEYVQKIHDGTVLIIVDNERRVKGVKQSVFEHVIETHCPRRKQVFVSLLKLLIILGIIGISLGLLTKTDKFEELHILMHVGTALFTCALPVIVKTMCGGPKKNYNNRKFEHDIRRSVADFVGYFNEDSADTEDDID